MIDIKEYKTGGLTINCLDVVEVAKTIERTIPFARDKANQLYYYNNGVYRQDGENIVNYMYRDFLERQGKSNNWRNTSGRKIADWIIPKAPMVLDRPDMYKLNLKNGIYYLGDYGKFESHNEYDHSDYRTTIQIPIEYNQSAECGKWDKFLTDVFPEDIQLLYDIVGLCMIPFTGLQKCIVLLGSGSNGKGTFLSAIQKVVGKENYANLDLKRLTGKDDRFSTSTLVGKLVNVFGDLPPTKMENSAIFKALTGQDTITIEYKGKQPFSYEPFARLIFSCNEMVETNDKTEGYKRRFFCIPFDKVFQVDAEVRNTIDDDLASAEELSGVLNRVIHRLPLIMETGLRYNEAATAKVDNYVPVPNWFKKWFNDWVIVDEHARIPSSDLYNFYVWSITLYKPSETYIDKGMMMTWLRALIPSLQCNKPAGVNGKTTRCYFGMRLKPDDRDRAPQMTSSKDIEELVEEEGVELV